MVDKVLKWIGEERLIQEDDAVIAGVSGGADSVCLLKILLKHREKTSFALQVIHVEHGIRGAESEADAVFVETLCRKYQVPFHVYHVNVPEYAKQNGLSLEEAARILRYDCYRQKAEELMAEGGASLPIKIALAHHANDNAETILFQMVRGSGLKGLCGMSAYRTFGENAVIIRPLLQSSREEIEEYLREQAQEFRIDGTNDDVEYSRNRIRRNVMPELLKINSSAVNHIAKSGIVLQEIADYLSARVNELMDAYCKEADGMQIAAELFEKTPLFLQREVIMKSIGLVSGSRKDIGAVHIEAVLNLAKLQVGRKIILPYGLSAVRNYAGIWMGCESEKNEVAGYEISREEIQLLERGEKLCVLLPDCTVEMNILKNNGKIPQIPKKKYTKWLNYDKIKNKLQIRKRLAGDYLIIDDNSHKKKLKEYFIEEKIPSKQRDNAWLLTEDSHVLWVVGGRISADRRIEERTERILEVHIIGGKYHED